MISVLWLLYLFLIGVVIAYLTYALFFDSKEDPQQATPIRKKIQDLKELVPPTSGKGWQLQRVDSGIRTWQKTSESSPSWIQETIYACSIIVPVSGQEVIDVLKQPSLLLAWDPHVKKVQKVTVASNHDAISVSFNCSNIFLKIVQNIRDFFGEEVNAIYSRQWEVDASQTPEAWFMSSFTEKVIPAEGAQWSCFFVSSIGNGENGESSCQVTLIVEPMLAHFAPVSWLTTSRLAGLQDFILHFKADTSPVRSSEAEVPVMIQSLSTSNNDATKLLENMTHVPSMMSCEQETASSTLLPSKCEDDAHLGNVAVVAPVKAFRSQVTVTLSSSAASDYAFDNNTTADVQKTEHTISDPLCLPHLSSSESIENLIEKLCALSDGTEGTDGWISVGKFKGVDILKRPAREGERPWDTLKGTSLLCVPIHYIVAYVFSLDYRGEWDDLLKKGKTVQEYGPLSKVTLMEYKPVWPASGRDFCTFWHLKRIDESVVCFACEAVEHESCPEQKGLVRAELVIGGFVVKEISSDPPKCLVTYITRVDLKGSLPTRLVNRVTSTQPQGVAIIRDKLEARYQADRGASDSGEMSKIEKEGVELWKELTAGSNESEAEETSDLFSASGNVSYTSDMFPITEENMQLPFLDRRNIDFRTLGNQAVANLLGEVLMANQVEIEASKEFTEQQSADRDWSYEGTEKDVIILRKISPGEKIHSFMGKGVIKLKPADVWQAVRDHMTRYVYDKMLKRIQVVKQIDDQAKILYLRLQAKQCLLKQARDFVLLTMEREESEKFVQASVSVELPELPPSFDITRATVKCCGWIIEPFQQNGQLYSMVSYLVQVDFGGVFPSWLMNLVTRRQPLCIAYLREYLEKSQDQNA